MTKQTIKQHILENLELDTIQDIVNHGCSGGVGGFIYYQETTAFHDENEEEIWDMLWEDSKDHGITAMELIAEFNGQKDVYTMTQFKNLLCWYAVERTCNEIINEAEEQ
jgi:hypothetical protein